MLNGIIDSLKVRAQKVVSSSQSSGSTFAPRCSKDRLKIEMFMESPRQWDKEMRQWNEAMRQWDDFYAQAFA
jgi:hypothetical protein